MSPLWCYQSINYTYIEDREKTIGIYRILNELSLGTKFMNNNDCLHFDPLL